MYHETCVLLASDKSLICYQLASTFLTWISSTDSLVLFASYNRDKVGRRVLELMLWFSVPQLFPQLTHEKDLPETIYAMKSAWIVASTLLYKAQSHVGLIEGSVNLRNLRGTSISAATTTHKTNHNMSLQATMTPASKKSQCWQVMPKKSLQKICN